jgi:hypothetical protein
MKKRIHINQHRIRSNSKEDSDKLPVISIKRGKDIHYADSVVVLGESKVVYNPDKPLSCGARVWIETEAELRVQYNSEEYTLL